MTTLQYRLLLFALGALFFLPFLGAAPLFDWDEVNFAESAREMLITGDYSRVRVNFQPFWEKPPLFIWMQAASMHIFGVNEYAARFPNALFGILNLLLLFELGRHLRSDRFGFLWAMGMFGALLPHVYFKSGIIDPVFNTFIFLAIWCIYKAARQYGKPQARSMSIGAGIFMGLAVLTKGPVGILLPVITTVAFWVFSRMKPLVSLLNLLYCAVAVFLVSAIWFGPETLRNGTWFLEEFIRYQIRLFSTPDAGHAQPFYYHFVVVLIGCFPISILALRVLFRPAEARLEDPDFSLWMKCLLWTVLLLFSVVTTKIVHYSSMAYLPLAALGAISMEEFLRGRQSWPFWKALGFLIPGLIPGLALLALPYIGRNPELVIPLIKDPFAVANLTAPVEWPLWCYLPGIVWISAVLLTWWYLWQQRRVQALTAMFSLLSISIGLFLTIFPAKIAGYTQNTALNYYRTLKAQNVYIETLRFKSFAQYFYGEKRGFSKAEAAHCKDADGNYHIDVLRQWYLEGDIDKPVYFVVKSIHLDEYIHLPQLELLQNKHGFALLKREPK